LQAWSFVDILCGVDGRQENTLLVSILEPKFAGTPTCFKATYKLSHHGVITARFRTLQGYADTW